MKRIVHHLHHAGRGSLGKRVTNNTSNTNHLIYPRCHHHHHSYHHHTNLKLVILEGDPIMTQKSKVLSRLNKMGYVTKSFPHVLDFAKQQQQQNNSNNNNNRADDDPFSHPSNSFHNNNNINNNNNNKNNKKTRQTLSPQSNNNINSRMDDYESDMMMADEADNVDYDDVDDDQINRESQDYSSIVDFEDTLFDYVTHVQNGVTELLENSSSSSSSSIHHNSPMRFKNQHLFIDASPLSIYPYLNEKSQKSCIEAMKEAAYRMKDQFNNHPSISSCRIYLCEADDIESSIRLGGHKYLYEQNYEPESSPMSVIHEAYMRQYRNRFNAIRSIVPEEDIVNFMHGRFNQLLNEKIWFENVLITTDTQQATCTLLEKYLDIQFKLPPMRE